MIEQDTIKLLRECDAGVHMGISSIDDVKKLREIDLYGAIIGKAYYLGAIDLREAVEVAK